MFSCSCGKLRKELLNDITRDLICPICKTNLIGKSISEQAKLDQYLIVKDSESAEAIRQKIYNYLSGKDIVDATDSEMKVVLGYKERSNISPRRNELCELGVVKASCKRMCTASKMNVTAWCLE